jgi:hypothetical protein
MGIKRYEANEFVKTGGTGSQYLLANGGVSTGPAAGDDNVQSDWNATSGDAFILNKPTIPTDHGDHDGLYLPIGGGSLTGALTIDSDTDTIFKLNSTDNGALYMTYARSDDRHAYVGFGGASDNFTIMSEETGGQIILGTAATTRVVIDDDGYVSMRERVGIGGDFTPQKALHLKNAAPVFRFEDSDITGGHLDMIKSSRNMRFDLEQDDATAATNFNFRIGGTTHLYMKNNFVGVMNDSPSEALDVTGNVAATSFIKTGGTSAQFLKADGSVDSSTYSTNETLNEVISSGNTYTSGTSVWTFSTGSITNADTGDDWGIVISPEEGILFTDGSGGTTGRSYLQASAVAVGNGTYVGKILSTNLTAERDLELPNAAGTLALTSQISTDFVSKAGGGVFDGDVTADAFILPGGTSGRFLKADGSTDSNTYVTGSGTTGNIAIFNTTNGLIDNSDFSFNFITSKVTMGADLDVVGTITTDTIQSDNWTYVPQTFQSNFVHSTGNSYMNLPFNSLSDASSGGEQHFLVTPYSGYVHSIAFKNTATGSTMTATNMNFRVLVNGVSIYTSSTQTFTAASRTYKAWALSDTNATFTAGNDLRVQFRCTSGFWQDTCAVVVLKCVI